MRLVGAALLACAAVPAAAQVAVQPLAPGEVLLEVTAEGRARVRPDRVALTGGVTTTGATAREALDANAAAMTRVVAAIRAAGAQAREVQTQQISVQPRFEQTRDYGERPRIIGYVAQNSVAVATGRIALAPRLIEAMFNAGATNVYGPTFAAENDRAVLQAARNDAAQAARAQADAYAASFGMRVARIVRVSERGRNVQPADILISATRISSVGLDGAPPPPPPPAAAEVPVQPGELDQRVTLFVDYALAPR